MDPANRIAKYADDTYLITGASKRDASAMELDHVANWAAQNNLRLNTNKSSKMVILRKWKTAPPSIPGIKRVSNMVILGVTICNDLHAIDHIDRLISTCMRSLYALRVLCTQGPHDQALHVTEATTMARLVYASPAWWGLTSAKQGKLDRFQSKVVLMAYLLKTSKAFAEKVEEAEE